MIDVYLAPAALLADVQSGSALVFEGAEARHAVTVMRRQPGDVVELVDGNGRRVRATIDTCQPPSAMQLHVDNVIDEPAPTPRVVVVQALPKGEHGELAVDLMTQAGADEIVPWAAQHSVAVWRGDKADKGVAKWRDAAVRAAKQCRRSRIPQIAPMASTAQVLDLVAAADRAVVLHEAATLGVVTAALPSEGNLLVIVGPEGGISEAERQAFTAAGAVEVLLGPEVLRSSFAGAAALVALGARGRWPAWEDAHHE